MGTRPRTFDIKKQSGFSFMAMLCFAFLYIPIAVLVVYAFNAGKNIAIWKGFRCAGLQPPGRMAMCRKLPYGRSSWR